MEKHTRRNAKKEELYQETYCYNGTSKHEVENKITFKVTRKNKDMVKIINPRTFCLVS